MSFKSRVVFCCLISHIFFFQMVHSGTVVEDVETNNIGRSLDPSRVLSTLANNLMSRGFIPTSTDSGSQLVTFNVQNLFYLVLLKVLIYAAATIAAGNQYKDGYARIDEDEQQTKFLTDEEVLMFLSFLSGSSSCLQNIACLQPHQAKKYVAAGDLLLKAAKMFSFNPNINYYDVIKEIDHASSVGLAGGKCSTFHCSNNKQ